MVIVAFAAPMGSPTRVATAIASSTRANARSESSGGSMPARIPSANPSAESMPAARATLTASSITVMASDTISSNMRMPPSNVSECASS